MNTVYCYDRFGTIKRLASLTGLVVVLSGAAALWDVQARATTRGVEVAQLPTVVVSGHRLNDSDIETLPRVVVEGHRISDEQLALNQDQTAVR